MCSPQIAFSIASLVGTGIQTFGALRAGNAASNESRFKSQVASNNAIIANQNADIALEKGRADVKDQRRLTKQRIGLQRAQLAGQGFDVSQGSSIDILSDTASLGELDVLRIEADAQNKARNLRNTALGFESEATLGRLASKNERKAGKISAASTLLTGAVKSGAFFLKP